MPFEILSKTKRQKFYNEKSLKLEDFEILASNNFLVDWYKWYINLVIPALVEIRHKCWDSRLIKRMTHKNIWKAKLVSWKIETLSNQKVHMAIGLK